MVGKIRPRKVLLPMDFGESKARREYQKSGLVIRYKKGEIPMQDLQFNDFLRTRDAQEAQNMLKQLVADNSDSKIADYWGISYAKLRKIRTELGIRKDKTGKMVAAENPNENFWKKFVAKHFSEEEVQEKTESPQETIEEKEEQEEKVAARAITPSYQKTFLTMSMEGEFSAQELSDRMDGIRSILTACANSNFIVKISIEEKS